MPDLTPEEQERLAAQRAHVADPALVPSLIEQGLVDSNVAKGRLRTVSNHAHHRVRPEADDEKV